MRVPAAPRSLMLRAIAVLLLAAAAAAEGCQLMVNGVNTTNTAELYTVLRAQQSHQLVDIFLTSPLPCAHYLSEKQRRMYVRAHTTDMDVIDQILIRHEFSEINTGLWEKLKQPPARIMDLGANVGAAAGYFASRFPEARIVSVEPSLGNFGVASLNTRKFSNIRLVHGAAWDVDSDVAISIHNRGEWGLTVDAVDNLRGKKITHAMPGYTVDHLMEMMGWDAIDYLKVDIETGEKHLFSARSLATGWLKKVTCLSVELHEHFDAGCCEKPFADAMASHDFKHILTTHEFKVWCQKSVEI